MNERKKEIWYTATGGQSEEKKILDKPGKILKLAICIAFYQSFLVIWNL